MNFLFLTLPIIFEKTIHFKSKSKSAKAAHVPCTITKFMDRQQLLTSLWNSMSTEDHTFLIQLHTASTFDSQITSSQATAATDKKDTTTLPLPLPLNDPHPQPTPKPTLRQITTLETGYKRSRLDHIVRQHSEYLNKRQGRQSTLATAAVVEATTDEEKNTTLPLPFNETHPQPTPKPTLHQISTLETGYRSSRLAHLVRHHSEQSNGATATGAAVKASTPVEENNTEPPQCEEKRSSAPSQTSVFETGYKKSRFQHLVRQHSDSSANNNAEPLRLHTDPTPLPNKRMKPADFIRSRGRRLSTLIRNNSGRRLSELKRTNSSSSNNINPTSTTTNQSDSMSRMSVAQQDEIVYRLLTQQMILDHEYDSGCIGRAKAFLYPYFSPEAVSKRAKRTEHCIMVLVCLNVISVIVSTEEAWFSSSITGEHEQNFAWQALGWFEMFSFLIFALEYVIRIWV